MTILVCPLSKVTEMVAQHRPGHVISVLDPSWAFPELGPDYANRHLRLSFHDVHTPTDEQVMPSREHICTLLRFLKARGGQESLLIHCRAGIGRSPAVAFIAACAASPGTDEHAIALALRQASPLARPNQVLVLLADHEMGRNGRMHRAVTAIGADQPLANGQENEPFQLAVPGSTAA